MAQPEDDRSLPLLPDADTADIDEAIRNDEGTIAQALAVMVELAQNPIINESLIKFYGDQVRDLRNNLRDYRNERFNRVASARARVQVEKEKAAAWSQALQKREVVGTPSRTDKAIVLRSPTGGLTTEDNPLYDPEAMTPEDRWYAEQERSDARFAQEQGRIDARQAQEQGLRRHIADQTAAISRGEIDARTAKASFDAVMESLRWAPPSRTGYLPGFEPGGPFAVMGQRSLPGFNPESYRAQPVDPFLLAQRMGTPFGTVMQGPGASVPPTPMGPAVPVQAPVASAPVTPFAAAQAEPLLPVPFDEQQVFGPPIVPQRPPRPTGATR